MTERIKKTGIEISVDYFKCSFPIQVNKEELESSEQQRIIEDVSKFLNISNDDVRPYYVNKYRKAKTLGEHIVLALSGPEFSTGYSSCLIELKGQGCREFEARNPDKTWYDIIKFFCIEYQGHMTRLDIAIDDFGNNVSFNYLIDKLDKKQFSSVFRDHNVNHFGSIEKGRSLSLGSHSSSMQLMIYEKGKEVMYKGKEIDFDFDYWIRYEMRFNQTKADDFIYTLIEKGEEFNKYSMGVFYSLLDIKDCNSREVDNVRKANTDPMWLTFLGNVEKCTLIHAKNYESSYVTYQNWIKNHAGKYVLYLLATHQFELESVFTELLQNAVDYAEDINKEKLKAINSNLRERKLSLLDENDIEKIRNDLIEIIEERRLPF